MFDGSALAALYRIPLRRDAAVESHGLSARGPVLRHRGPADILSDATPIGSLQVPASGQPILLMADRQTTGGYPKIATVITADLPIAGQLAPGDWIEFASRHAARRRSPRSSSSAPDSRRAHDRDAFDRAAPGTIRRRHACGRDVRSRR